MERNWTTFDEMVRTMAVNAPHALIADWHMRLDKAITTWFVNSRVKRPGTPTKVYDVLITHGGLPQDAIDEINQLRRLRNRVVHEEYLPGIEEAETYARSAWRLAWMVADLPVRMG